MGQGDFHHLQLSVDNFHGYILLFVSKKLDGIRRRPEEPWHPLPRPTCLFSRKDTRQMSTSVMASPTKAPPFIRPLTI